jgi:hypothetical protein
MPKAEEELHGLIGLSMPLPLESPASWLTRAALSQGETVAALLAHLNLSRMRDLDLAITSEAGRKAIARCGVSAHFSLASRILGRLRGLGKTGASLLLSTREGRPRSRFCPQCLSAQRESYFEIHCRFAPWRFCPLHHCLLEDACPHCAHPVVLPFDMVCAGSGKSGIGYLSQCQSCAKSLTAAQAVALDSLRLSEWDHLRDGVMRVDDHVAAPLSNLKRLAKMGVLPMHADQLTADAARQKLPAQLASEKRPKFESKTAPVLLIGSKSLGRS